MDIQSRFEGQIQKLLKKNKTKFYFMGFRLNWRMENLSSFIKMELKALRTKQRGGKIIFRMTLEHFQGGPTH